MTLNFRLVRIALLKLFCICILVTSVGLPVVISVLAALPIGSKMGSLPLPIDVSVATASISIVIIIGLFVSFNQKWFRVLTAYVLISFGCLGLITGFFVYTSVDAPTDHAWPASRGQVMVSTGISVSLIITGLVLEIIARDKSILRYNA